MGLRWFASRAGLPAPWLRGFDDTELTLVAGALLALAILLLALAILAARTCRARCCAAAGPSSEMAARGLGRVAEEEPANAEDYAKLQVCVRGADEMAELEVETDGFESYEELRELVVDAVPSMFCDTDELCLEYAVGRSDRWVRVKRSTPLDEVKAARAARITIVKPAAHR